MSGQLSTTPEFNVAFLKPRFWGTWLLLGFLWLLSKFPRKFVMRCGALVGDQMGKRNSKRRHIAQVNLKLCFPELDDLQRQDILMQHFRCFGQGIMDIGLSMMSNAKRVRKSTRYIGLNQLKDLPKSKSGILVCYHTTTLDMGASSILAGIDTVSVMKRDKNPLLNWFMYRARVRDGHASVYMRDQGLRGMIKEMRQGKIGLLIPDEDFGDEKHSVYAPFFGQQRATLNIVSRLAKITDAIVLPAICRLNSETGMYESEVLPPLFDFPSGDDIADARRLNQTMEELIRKAPEQYLWTFRWFRTQSDGIDPYV